MSLFERGKPSHSGIAARLGNPFSNCRCGVNLTVIVPVYNEAATVGEVLDKLCREAAVTQVIVVDDGSTDGSKSTIEQFEDDSRVRLFEHITNQGKGRAIRTGLEHVRTEYVLIQDADLEYSPSDIVHMLEATSRDGVDVVYGSRYLAPSEPHRGRVLHHLCIKVLNLMCRILYGIRLTDEATCYKLFRAEDLRCMKLSCVRFEFCPEVTAKAARMGLKIVEVPIRYTPRTVDEGKKIRLRDGIEAIWQLLRHRVSRFK